jgi:cytochrome P450
VDAKHFAAPDEFRPERWLTDGAAQGAHEPSAHIPFGSGPRICPGRTLALLEMKVVLSMLFSAFEVERVGDADAVDEVFAFTMSPRGVRVHLRARERLPSGPQAFEAPRALVISDAPCTGRAPLPDSVGL